AITRTFRRRGASKPSKVLTSPQPRQKRSVQRTIRIPWMSTLRCVVFVRPRHEGETIATIGHLASRISVAGGSRAPVQDDHTELRPIETARRHGLTSPTTPWLDSRPSKRGTSHGTDKRSEF